MMRSRSCSRVLLAATATTLLAMTACDDSAVPTEAPATAARGSAANARWNPFVEEFIESYFVTNPSFAVSQGRHEFDGKLGDWSAAGIHKEIARLERLRERALDFVDLSRNESYQRDYLVNRIDSDLFWLRDARAPFGNPAWYFSAGLDPRTYVSVPYAPAAVRLRAFIGYARSIPAAVTEIKTNLAGPLPATFIEFGGKSFDGLAEFYRNDVPRAFAEVEDPALRKELAEAIEPAAEAMRHLSDWIVARQPGGSEAYALGAERFARMLRMTESVETPLEQLWAIGHADLQRNLSVLAETCKRYAPGVSIGACVATMNANKPEGGAIAGARRQLAELERFVVERDIVSIPAEVEALVSEAPAYRRQNFALINIPGAYERNLPSIYYIAPPDPSWPEAERQAYVPGEADLLFTSVHEVWPGHFLQSLHSKRSPWRFGQLFVSYAYFEGWAHYAEELMIEEGIAQDAPELLVGQLVNALLRNVRCLCAIGLHTQRVTVAQCEQSFREQAYQDPGNARQQAARGTYDPGYLNYTIGKLMIRKLRADWSAERSGSHGWRQFHDELLSYGGPPVPLLRAHMLSSSSATRELF